MLKASDKLKEFLVKIKATLSAQYADHLALTTIPSSTLASLVNLAVSVGTGKESIALLHSLSMYKGVAIAANQDFIMAALLKHEKVH